MKRSNRLIILVGVLLAVLAFVGVVVFLNQGVTPSPEEQVVTETVLVAVEEIDIGEEVTPDKAREEQIDPEAVQGTALRSTTQLIGQPSLVRIPAEAQISAEAVGLTEQRLVDLSAQLEPGQKAIAFQVDRTTGLDFLVTAGDDIDIVLTQQISVLQETADSAANTDEAAPPRFEQVTGLENQRTVKAVLQDKRVLYVSDTRATAPEMIDTDGDGVADTPAEETPIDSVIIVFAGTLQDAELIKYAQNDFSEIGFLTAVVRHAEDDEIEETTGLTIDQLVEQYGLRIPDIVQQLSEGLEEAP